MKHQKFRLIVKPGFEGAIRVAQLHKYAESFKDGQSALISPNLLDYVRSRFYQVDPSTVLNRVLEEEFDGWRIESDSQQGDDSLVITTEGLGISLLSLVELIENFVPEALGQRMIYEPLVLRRPSEYDFYLH